MVRTKRGTTKALQYLYYSTIVVGVSCGRSAVGGVRQVCSGVRVVGTSRRGVVGGVLSAGRAAVGLGVVGRGGGAVGGGGGRAPLAAGSSSTIIRLYLYCVRRRSRSRAACASHAAKLLNYNKFGSVVE